ncbi:MAG: TonB-dependent receptor [Niabella sp.]|nr:TonB-dependent receptor [Niabella sp.]
MRYLLFWICLLCSGFIYGQGPDTVKTIESVTVHAFDQSENRATAVVRKLAWEVPSNKLSLVTALNTISGVRMEERSPGSYRINIRGSSLRAPFGVRNVKVYWGDIPLTDPGGNTYFNQLAYNNFKSLTVFKGPASSMYGAGTGGLILLEPPGNNKSGINVEYAAGSYNTQSVFADASWNKENLSNTVTYAHNQSVGYRAQSAMQRNNLSWNTHIKWKDQELSALLLFSDLYYQTPGALTLKEFKTNPAAARPAAGAFPSAAAINAAIWQKNITAGVTHKQHFGEAWSNTTSLYSSFTQFKNSAIRNYENRNEPQFGGRSVFTYSKKWNGNNTLQWNTGVEAQQGYSTIRVSGNNRGRPDTLQTDDDVNIGTYSVFTQGTVSLRDSWVYTAGLSYNKSKLGFTRLNVYPVAEQVFHYNNELAPRFTVLRKLGFADLLATVSRGFSPPAVAEILPSTTIINKDLKAEHGWNYELTGRKHFSFNNASLHFELTGFYFDLTDAITQRRDASGADYFINAGAVKERGVEFYGNYLRTFRSNSFFNYLNTTINYTYNHFRYGNFVKDTIAYSGNRIPGVPTRTVNVQLVLDTQAGFFADANYYGASSVFLNDANAERANAYHLLGAKIGYRKKWNKINLTVYAGADNLLNETYSLGNDINAAAGRYYNAAPKRNFFTGAAFEWR